MREIFRRMPEYLRPARAAGFDAVVGWQITGAGGHGRPGDVDEHWIRIRDRRCTVFADQPGTADISFRTDPATLLRVVTGNEDPVLAVLKQRLSVRGDLALARPPHQDLRRRPGLSRPPSTSLCATGACYR